MAIDDPLDAAILRIEADEGIAGSVISALEGCASIGVAPASAAAKLIRLVTHGREENVKYLLDVVVTEVRRVRLQVEQLSEEHRRFIEEEFPKALTEAVSRAEETASKTRIRRMGVIVVGAMVHAPTGAAEAVSEMLRVSVALSDEDLEILARIYSVQVRPLTQVGFLPDQNVANTTWQTLEKLPGFRKPSIFGICAKLQSLGLLVQVERVATMLGLTSIPYSLTINGKEYVEAVGKASTATVLG